MGYADRFLLGPVGKMLALPPNVADGLDAPYERTQAVQRGLAGGTTVDVFGAHRAWQFEFSHRSGSEAAKLIARWTSPIFTRTVRLIDPLTPNRLSLDAASGGGVSGLPDAATASVGTVARAIPDAMPDEVDGLLDGAYRWEPGSVAADLLLDAARYVPVRAGEPLEFRVYARGTATVTPLVRLYHADDTTTDDTSAAVALSTTSWQQVAHTGTVVQPGEIAAAPGLKVALGDAARYVELTAAVLTADPDAADWTPGGGAPVVALTAFDHAYGRLGLRKMTLTVREV